MDIQEALARLTRTTIFKEWHEKNKEYYLAHAFIMLDEPNKNTWQIGFYNSSKERMVTFMLTGNDVQHTEDQEVLKKEGTIEKLNPSEIKIHVQQALDTAKECLQKEYKGQTPLKEFFIIQNAEKHHMYNITYFTQSLTTINIKIDAGTGKIIKHTSQKLADFA